jgi:hypothetical protein
MVLMDAAKAEAINVLVEEALAAPEFAHAVQRLRGELVHPTMSHGYERPRTSSLQSAVERQQMPALPGSEDLLVAERQFIRPHIEAALKLESPFARAGGLRCARPDLRAAARWSSSFKGSKAARSSAIQAERGRRLRVFGEISQSLANVDAKLQSLQTIEARGVQSKGASMALYAAAIRAAGIPDVGFTADQVHGFPCIGDVPDSGLFRTKERAAEKNFSKLFHPKHNSQVASSLRRAAARATLPGREPERWTLEVITRKTREEVKAGVAFGPFTADEIDAKFGAGCWRCLHRFGVEQGFEADGVTIKIRPCDNGRTGLHNACMGSHETIAVEDAAFPMLAADLFAEFAELDGEPRPAMQHSTDDVDRAYRRMAAMHPEATVVALFDTEVGDVRYYTMNGFPFGLASAVLAFNRHSQVTAMIARRFFGVCTAAFFDDYSIAEPVYAGATGKRVLRKLHGWLGVPLAEGAKDVAGEASNPFLGVVSDLSRFVQGEAFLRSKPSRVAKLVTAIEGFLETRDIKGDPLSLFGKLEYTTNSAGYYRLGRAALSALREWHKETRDKGVGEGCLPPLALEALDFFRSALPNLPPRRFTFGERRDRLPHITVYTDAMYESSAAVPGRVGIAIFDPTLVGSKEAPSGWLHSSAAVPAWLLAKLTPRKQQIGPLETLGALLPYLSLPTRFRDREVVAFIDNSGALFNLSSGNSRAVDTARLVHVFHCLCAALQTQVWFEFVPSGANLADEPSRDEFGLLHEMGSTWFDVVWPDMESSWAGVFESILDEFGKKPTGGEKRVRAEVGAEIARERAKLARARKP